MTRVRIFMRAFFRSLLFAIIQPVKNAFKINSFEIKGNRDQNFQLDVWESVLISGVALDQNLASFQNRVGQKICFQRKIGKMFMESKELNDGEIVIRLLEYFSGFQNHSCFSQIKVVIAQNKKSRQICLVFFL